MNANDHPFLVTQPALQVGRFFPACIGNIGKNFARLFNQIVVTQMVTRGSASNVRRFKVPPGVLTTSVSPSRA
jgi:hypothetical protein